MADRTSPTRLPLVHLQVKGSVETLQVGTRLRSTGGRHAHFCQLLRQTDTHKNPVLLHFSQYQYISRKQMCGGLGKTRTCCLKMSKTLLAKWDLLPQ